MSSLCHSEDLLEIRAMEQILNGYKKLIFRSETLNPKQEVNSQTEIHKQLEATTGKINSDYSIHLMEAGFLNY